MNTIFNILKQAGKMKRKYDDYNDMHGRDDDDDSEKKQRNEYIKNNFAFDIVFFDTITKYKRFTYDIFKDIALHDLLNASNIDKFIEPNIILDNLINENNL